MDKQEFISRYPQLFHMAADGSWPSIKVHGLMSTRALVDFYQPSDEIRRAILEEVRRRNFILMREGLPAATVRDQLPLKFLKDCLLPGVTELDFLNALNERVFFHVSRERLERLLGARAYRRHPHHVLTLDTARFLETHPDAELSPYNSGSVHLPTMPARGPSMFTSLDEYEWDYWRGRRGSANAVVELTVAERADVIGSVVRVERWDGGSVESVIAACSETD